jgi:hypothetical protein
MCCGKRAKNTFQPQEDGYQWKYQIEYSCSWLYFSRAIRVTAIALHLVLRRVYAARETKISIEMKVCQSFT